jgi:hypothetical protein
MNTSNLLTLAKMNLGIYGLRLPFDDPDGALLECINVNTIPTFSRFFPYKKTFQINLNKDLKKISNTSTKYSYLLPDFMPGMPIITILDMDDLDTNYYTDPFMDPTAYTYKNMMLAKVDADLISTLAPSPTFDFQSPNILIVYSPYITESMVNLTIGFQHNKNLSTISEGLAESFIELAIIDIKRFLYNTMKHYTEINSAFGTINLKIDDWSNAESDRKDLINQYRDSYHLETKIIDYI